MSARLPTVAGMFYEADPDALRKRIEWAFTHPFGPGEVPKPSTARRRESHAFMAPHAGYIYSGPVAAHTYYRIALEGRADTYVILGPNHTGYGEPVAVYPEGKWLTPLGEVLIDEELAGELVSRSKYARPDKSAHEQEHSIEVQLPFLQFIFGKVRIVPIALLYQTPSIARDLARSILEAAESLGRDVVVIASSDMTHYEPNESAHAKDRKALEKIVSLDVDGLFETINRLRISMCGPGPVMTAMEFTKLMGGSKGEVLKYATSGDITGDTYAVVGYASVRFF